MIKAVIFDLDNTLLDFMKMKSMSIDAAIYGISRSFSPHHLLDTPCMTGAKTNYKINPSTPPVDST